MSGRIVCVVWVAALASGCTSGAVERSQRLQVVAMVQYRDEMAAYHEAMRARLLAAKLRE